MSQRPRRQGMSRNEPGVRHLLSTYRKPQPTPKPKPKPSNEHPVPSADPHAPPEASSDEEDQESDTTAGSYSQRGAIQKTKFETKAIVKDDSPAQSPRQRDERQVTRSTRSSSLRKRPSVSGGRLLDGKEADEVPNDLPAAKRQKRDPEVTKGDHGAQHISNPFEHHKKPVVTYKKRNSLSSSRDSRGVAGALNKGDKESPQKKLQRPTSITPEPTSPRKRLYVPNATSEDSPVSEKRLRLPRAGSKASLNSSPGRAVTRSSRRNRPVVEDASSPEVKLKTRFTRDESPKAAGLGEDDNNHADIMLESEVDATPPDTPSQATSSPVCPICDEPVDDEELWDQFANRTRMGFNQQMKFCVAHRRRSAQATWASNGYPTIDWPSLDSRMAKHHGHLEGILAGDECHFRDVLNQKVMGGKDRTLKKSDDRLVPGYYGLRGLRSMSDNIIDSFSGLISRRAVQDKLISARGPTAFVQAVMVPELAVQLIMEDMDATAERARQILYDSIGLGELLNEDIADVVLKDKETDGEEDEED